ncbi:methylated-DNA--[protein]-cysteine S-methyltransferase [Prolixibacteraceae bacterium JC049]|jgi:O-6-methylguanine DNA methyltransferase|nr:methylated-DNA--[protein]-cysteine S-methyltransferase [Prolixibacteraceae bacterium JC049]
MKTPIYQSHTETPIGEMLLCATEKGLSLAQFKQRKDFDHHYNKLLIQKHGELVHEENEHITSIKQQLAEYFEGKRQQFDIAKDIVGTHFQQTVWEMLQNIPYGTTISYQEQANQMNNPMAIRAIASANGMNPLEVIIPCHRVVGKDGNLTGYSSGLQAKKWLLSMEKGLIIYEPTLF